jgi:ABC-type uncharacterized transport system substrate-binding protein
MMRRRDVIAGLGAAATTRSAWAQRRSMPIVAFVHPGSAEVFAQYTAVFRQGLSEAGHVEGQSVMVEYHWLNGQYDRLPALIDDFVSRPVTVIATAGSTSIASAAKAATATIPVVFGVLEDPVKLGLVASLAHPGGNATGINFLNGEVVAKLLELLHALVPKAVRFAVLVNPSEAANAEITVRDARRAAGILGLQIEVVSASTSREIDAAFDMLAGYRSEGLVVAVDGFFIGRRAQLCTLAARDRIPTAYSTRDFVPVGGLMSYGSSVAYTFRQVGLYAGNILRGAKPADLPVIQSTTLEFVLNLQTARALRIDVPPTLLALADEVID